MEVKELNEEDLVFLERAATTEYYGESYALKVALLSLVATVREQKTQIESLTGHRDSLKEAYSDLATLVLETLTVPAAEHVPAITDVWDILREKMGEEWWKEMQEKNRRQRQ